MSMSTITTLTGETVAEKDLRAATEGIDVELHAPGMFRVTSGDGESEYIVDVSEPACGCGDYFWRNNHCKHLRKIEMLAGQRQIPNVTGLDEDLREMAENDASGTESEAETDEGTGVALADGGVRSAEPTLQTGLESDDDVEISINRIVASVTTTVEDLPDFSYDEDNPEGCGEPFSSIVRCAQATIERIVANEATTTTADAETTDL